MVNTQKVVSQALPEPIWIMIRPPKSNRACIKKHNHKLLSFNIKTVSIAPIKNVYAHCNSVKPTSAPLNKLVKWNKENKMAVTIVINSGACLLFFK